MLIYGCSVDGLAMGFGKVWKDTYTPGENGDWGLGTDGMKRDLVLTLKR